MLFHPAVVRREWADFVAMPNLALQHPQLMPQRGILDFKRTLDLKCAETKSKQKHISATIATELSNSVTRSILTGFLVHTGVDHIKQHPMVSLIGDPPINRVSVFFGRMFPGRGRQNLAVTREPGRRRHRSSGRFRRRRRRLPETKLPRRGRTPIGHA